MHIKNIYSSKKPVISFEIFPPKQDIEIEKLKNTLTELKPLSPDFISVTCGAGGTDSAGKTLEVAAIVKNEFDIETMAHLTCVTATKAGISSTLAGLSAGGIENVLALRGDIPDDGRAVSSDYTFAKDLIPEIKSRGFCVGAASYPEGHLDCEDFGVSIEHLKQKYDAGADFFVSQLFFDNDIYCRFTDAARRAGIDAPLVAGVMPILSTGQVKRMIFMCGVSLPARIVKLLNKYENDPASLKQAGIDYAYEQISGLIRSGCDGVHIYTMNTPHIAKSNVERLRRERVIV